MKENGSKSRRVPGKTGKEVESHISKRSKRELDKTGKEGASHNGRWDEKKIREGE